MSAAGQVDDAAVRAALCADLLELGRPLDAWLRVSMALALAALIFGVGHRGFLLVSLPAAAVAFYYGLRVRFDAAVFGRWARDWRGGDDVQVAGTLSAFDAALGSRAAPRSVAQRCAGARALLVRQAVAVAVHSVLVLTAALMQ